MRSNSNFKLNFYPGLILLLTSSFLIYKYVLQVYPSVITNSLMQAFHVNGAGLGNLAATFFYSYLITQLFVGVLLDRFSVRWLSAAAIFVSALGSLFFSASHELWAAALARALMGVGAAFATVTYLKMAATWFKASRFAFISGLLATAAMLGAVLGEAPLSMLIAHYGWRSSLLLIGVVGIAFASLFAALVRDHNPNQTIKISHHAISFRDVWRVLSKPYNWVLTFYSGLAFAPLAVFSGLWGNPFMQEAYGLDSTGAAGLVSLSFIGLAIGGPLLGWLADRSGSRRTIMFFGTLTSLLAVTSVIYLHFSHTWELGALLFIFGFGVGAFMLGFAEGKMTNPIALVATVVAMINTGDAIFGAVTEPLIGRFLDAGWGGKMVKGAHYFSIHDYQMAFLVLPVYLLLALGLVLLMKSSKSSSLLNDNYAEINEVKA